MKKMMSGVALAVTVMMTSVGDIGAQERMRGAGMRDGGPAGGIEMIMRARERLELTDQQFEQLDALRREALEWRTANAARMQAMRSELEAGLIERSDLMRAMEEHRDASQGIREGHRERVESILTEDQREKVRAANMRRAFRSGEERGMRGRAQRGGNGQPGMRGGRGMRGNSPGGQPALGRRGPRGGPPMRGRVSGEPNGIGST